MKALVIQSDFGLDDGAVASMYGVALSCDPSLQIYNLTHNIPPYNIWEGSFRLAQTIGYWPQGTVFVSVVDPGVGSDRMSVVAKTATGHYIVTPDNGTLTHVHAIFGITEVRQIDEGENRLRGSEASYTFHGRDVYAYTGARLAAGIISYEEVGPRIDPSSLVLLPLSDTIVEPDSITGTIDALDVRYGSLWTSIPRAQFLDLGFQFGDRVRLYVTHNGGVVHANHVTYVPSFASVEVGESLAYVNSLDRMAVAINRGSYARAFDIATGPTWHITLAKL
ncbi:SAM hydrolase/SAM-dependent halogenase family protein [Trueperella pecoris]|uniref:SAM hydrolase/SAM-dependent halogenase family protein n=1 Tax=Trueperella pecoris TaxID=2733571 RepID=UPI00186B95D4|nr:S-adenosyl-l-methionine hydroxide adenosyltransferase family protein [Trueperella pecoris]QOQ38405.1 S-adenosyl-l-methionine hydroxide adenosyltransferase family protein [Trueperella pecoris]QTG75013.1 S-adenosyl-l-methionine hydroxide adenosyltransferase family protein [Trueperella pecoris]